MKKIKYHRFSELKLWLINDGAYFINWNHDTIELLEYLLENKIFLNSNYIVYQNEEDIDMYLNKWWFDIDLYTIDDSFIKFNKNNNYIYWNNFSKDQLNKLSKIYQLFQNKIYAKNFVDNLFWFKSKQSIEFYSINKMIEYLNRLSELNVIVKSPFWKWGKWNIVIKTKNDIVKLEQILWKDIFYNKLEKYDWSKSYIIENYINNKFDINVNVFFTKKSFDIIWYSEQITEQVFYRWNEINNRLDYIKNNYNSTIIKLCNKIRESWYLWPMWIDFMISENNIYFNEFNTRINSSTNFVKYCNLSGIKTASLLLFKSERIISINVIKYIMKEYLKKNNICFPYEINWEIGTIIFFLDKKFCDDDFDFLKKNNFIPLITNLNWNPSIDIYNYN